jgi:DNA-binding response OmpR family regulator
MHKLLFIHPDAKLQRIYEKSLSNLFGFDSAYDGLQGLRMIFANKPDIIVSDYHLPKISGASLLAEVRGRNDLSHTPFIFFSTIDPSHDSLGLGANDWLVIAQTNPDILAAKCFQHLKQKAKLHV